jgi:SPP1 gp7 family putative phage head morphogenesis protein
MATITVNDTLIDLYVERAIDLLRLEAGTRNKVFALLSDLEKEIINAIAAIDPSEPKRVTYRRERLKKLLAIVHASVQASYRGINSMLAQEIRDIIDLEASWTGRTINATVKIDFFDYALTPNQVTVLASDVLIQGAPTKEWWSRQASGVVARFADEMRRGVALGEANEKLVQRVRGTATTRGLMDISRSAAERLVRSSVQTAANVAREAMYAQNDDLMTALQWHSTLDLRTSHWCIVRDGLKYQPKSHKPIGHSVPWLEGPGKLHWCCRSTSVPVLKSWRELGIDEDEMPETTRASMNGQVSAKTTFEDWLRRRTSEQQDEVLGAGKADLWRSGKITFRDLLDQNGRPLTTQELRAKAARR